MPRIFISIDIPESIKNKLADFKDQLAEFNLPVRWAKKENIHLTIVFLGEVKEEKLERIKEICQKIVPKYPSFILKIKEFGWFPNENPRILWLGLKDESVLLNLQKELTLGFKKAGFKIEDREFSPHLTIGRTKTRIRDFSQVKKSIDQFLVNAKLGEFRIGLVKVVKSKLTPEGPIYKIIQKFPLKD